MDALERFAQNLALLRDEARLSTNELADRANLPPGEVEEVEGAAKAPSFEAMVRLPGALGVSVGKLFEGVRPEDLSGG